MAQSIFHFTGFESGGSGEITSLGAGASVQGTTVRTGAYALKQGTGSSTPCSGMNATQWAMRGYFQFPSLPGADTQFLLEKAVGGTVNRLKLNLTSAGKVKLTDAASTLGIGAGVTGTTVLSVNIWYLFDIVFDAAAGGVIKVWINGNLEIDTTHSNDVSSSTTDRITVLGASNPNEYFFDDLRTDIGGVAQIGPGRCIARQGKAGTPTYDAWTKTGAATAALCLSDTPFSATTNCNSTTSAVAQTMLVAPFSQVQSGHGTEVVSPIDVINACKTAVIAKRTTSGNPSIRRRIGGADTDTAKAVTAADLYYDDGIWTTTPANLDTAEIGMVKAADANSTTVEDAWLMADVTSVWGPPSVGCWEAPIIRPRVEMVAY